eukprot:m.1541497 g.1541497  ORF g.1541497 m.1541497 type:complete len:2747 (-) comp25250_c0_seq5:32-8272(-)
MSTSLQTKNLVQRETGLYTAASEFVKIAADQVQVPNDIQESRARARGVMHWKAALIDLIEQTAAQLSPVSLHRQLVDIGEDLLVQTQEYEFCLQTFVEPYLLTIAVPTGTTDANFSVSSRAFETSDGGYTVRAAILAAHCRYKLAVTDDPDGARAPTRALIDEALGAMRHVMQRAQPKQDYAWVVYNASQLVYTAARDLLDAGAAALVVETLVWTLVCVDHTISLLSSRHLRWRARLYAAACECYFQLRLDEHAKALAKRCNDIITQLETLEGMSTLANEDASEVYSAARRVLGAIEFRSSMWINASTKSGRRRHTLAQQGDATDASTEQRLQWASVGGATLELLSSTVPEPLQQLPVLCQALRRQRSPGGLNAGTEASEDGPSPGAISTDTSGGVACAHVLHHGPLQLDELPARISSDRNALARRRKLTPAIVCAGVELCHQELLTGDAAVGGWQRVGLVFEFAQLAFSYEQFDVYKAVSQRLQSYCTSRRAVQGSGSTAPQAGRLSTHVVAALGVLDAFARLRELSIAEKKPKLYRKPTAQPAMTNAAGGTSRYSSELDDVAMAVREATRLLSGTVPVDDGCAQIVVDAAVYLWEHTGGHLDALAAAGRLRAEFAGNTDGVQRLRIIHNALCELDTGGAHVGVSVAVALRLGSVLAAEGSVSMATAEGVLREGLTQVERHRQNRSDRDGADGMRPGTTGDGGIRSLHLELLWSLWTTVLAAVVPGPECQPPAFGRSRGRRSARSTATRTATRPATRTGDATPMSAVVAAVAAKAEQLRMEFGADPDVAALLDACVVSTLATTSACTDSVNMECSKLLSRATSLLTEGGGAGRTRARASCVAPVIRRRTLTSVDVGITEDHLGPTVAYARVFGRRIDPASDKGKTPTVRFKDNKLCGTNVPISARRGACIRVSGLQSNAEYRFAVALYDTNLQLVSSTIGETTGAVTTSFALSREEIWGRLGNAALQCNNKETFHRALGVLWSSYTATTCTAAAFVASIHAGQGIDPAVLPLLVPRGVHDSSAEAPAGLGDGCNVNDSAVRAAASGSVQCFVQLLMGLTDEAVQSHALQPAIDAAYPHHLAGTAGTRAACAEALVVALRCALLTRCASLALACITRVYALFAAALYARVPIGSVAAALLATCRHALHQLLIRPARWGVHPGADLALATRMFACLAQWEHARLRTHPAPASSGAVSSGTVLSGTVSSGAFAALLHDLLALDARGNRRTAKTQTKTHKAGPDPAGLGVTDGEHADGGKGKPPPTRAGLCNAITAALDASPASCAPLWTVGNAVGDTYALQRSDSSTNATTAVSSTQCVYRLVCDTMQGTSPQSAQSVAQRKKYHAHYYALACHAIDVALGAGAWEDALAWAQSALQDLRDAWAEAEHKARNHAPPLSDAAAKRLQSIKRKRAVRVQAGEDADGPSDADLSPDLRDALRVLQTTLPATFREAMAHRRVARRRRQWLAEHAVWAVRLNLQAACAAFSHGLVSPAKGRLPTPSGPVYVPCAVQRGTLDATPGGPVIDAANEVRVAAVAPMSSDAVSNIGGSRLCWMHFRRAAVLATRRAHWVAVYNICNEFLSRWTLITRRQAPLPPSLRNAPIKCFTAVTLSAADLVAHCSSTPAPPCAVPTVSATVVTVQLFVELAAVLLSRGRYEAVLDTGATVLDAVERACHAPSTAPSPAPPLATYVHTVARLMLVATAATSEGLSGTARAAVVASCHAAMDRAPIPAVWGGVTRAHDAMDQVASRVGTQSIASALAALEAVNALSPAEHNGRWGDGRCVPVSARVHLAFGRLLVAHVGRTDSAGAGALGAWERAVAALVGVPFTVDTCDAVLRMSPAGPQLLVGAPEAGKTVSLVAARGVASTMAVGVVLGLLARDALTHRPAHQHEAVVALAAACLACVRGPSTSADPVVTGVGASFATALGLPWGLVLDTLHYVGRQQLAQLPDHEGAAVLPVLDVYEHIAATMVHDHVACLLAKTLRLRALSKASRFEEAECVLLDARALSEGGSAGTDGVHADGDKSGQPLLCLDAPLWDAANAAFVDAVLGQKWAAIEGVALRWAPVGVVRLLQLERVRLLVRVCSVAMATGLEPKLGKERRKSVQMALGTAGKRAGQRAAKVGTVTDALLHYCDSSLRGLREAALSDGDAVAAALAEADRAQFVMEHFRHHALAVSLAQSALARRMTATEDAAPPTHLALLLRAEADLRWWLGTRMCLARALLLCGRTEAAATQCARAVADGSDMLATGDDADVAPIADQLEALRAWCAAQGLAPASGDRAIPSAAHAAAVLWDAWCHRTDPGRSTRYVRVLPLLPAVVVAAARAAWGLGAGDDVAVVRLHLARCADALAALGSADGSERVGVAHARAWAAALALCVGVATNTTVVHDAASDTPAAAVPDTTGLMSIQNAWSELQQHVGCVLQQGNGAAARDMCSAFALATWAGRTHGDDDARAQVVQACIRLAGALARHSAAMLAKARDVTRAATTISVTIPPGGSSPLRRLVASLHVLDSDTPDGTEGVALEDAAVRSVCTVSVAAVLARRATLERLVQTSMAHEHGDVLEELDAINGFLHEHAPECTLPVDLEFATSHETPGSTAGECRGVLCYMWSRAHTASIDDDGASVLVAVGQSGVEGDATASSDRQRRVAVRHVAPQQLVALQQAVRNCAAATGTQPTDARACLCRFAELCAPTAAPPACTKAVASLSDAVVDALIRAVDTVLDVGVGAGAVTLDDDTAWLAAAVLGSDP